MKCYHLLFLLVCIIPTGIWAQSTDEIPIRQEDHGHGNHEVAIATSTPYFVNEKKLSYSVHFHYVYKLPNTKLGLGLEYESILLAPKHNTFGLVTSYSPLEDLNLSISPGVSFENGDATPFFSLHTELSYEFEVGMFHLGPAFEFAYDPNDYHLSLGIHVGYVF